MELRIDSQKVLEVMDTYPNVVREALTELFPSLKRPIACGDIFHIDAHRVMLTQVEYNTTALIIISPSDDLGNRWVSPVKVENAHNITLEEFGLLLGTYKNRVREILATRESR